MKRMLLLLVFLFSPSLVQADRFSLSGYIEVGRSSTAEDYIEEDSDEDYAYYNYHFEFEHKTSNRLIYDARIFIYNKDYETVNALDNISRIFKTGWHYYIRKLKGKSVKLDLKLKYKEKRYDNAPRSEYDQIRAAPTLTFKKNDIYTVNVAAGIDNCDYLEAGEKDQLKIFGKVGGNRYFLEKKLMLVSSYKIETTKQKKINRERTKHDLLGGLDYIFNLPGIYKITIRTSWGQRDTKEEEQRDEDYDYEYWRYYIKTEHKISLKLETNLKCQYFNKNYNSANLDHTGFYIRNQWDYEILDDRKQRFWLEFEAEYKDLDYAQESGNSYRKEMLKTAASYQKKKNWKVSGALEGNFYDYYDSSKDKERYYLRLSGEKLFVDGDLKLSLDLKYRFTDYNQKGDTEQEAARVTFSYRF